MRGPERKRTSRASLATRMAGICDAGRRPRKRRFVSSSFSARFRKRGKSEPSPTTRNAMSGLGNKSRATSRSVSSPWTTPVLPANVTVKAPFDARSARAVSTSASTGTRRPSPKIQFGTTLTLASGTPLASKLFRAPRVATTMCDARL